MKCHYQVLEVARDADDAAIKTSYRKQALRWHPDKNLDNADEAKTKFQVIQQAYEVLSDPQERSWYDRHREQILRGSDSYADDSLDVFQFFTVTCYRGYDDAAGAFYAVYRDVFERLASEDAEFEDSDDEDGGDPAPGFGGPTSDYETTVGPFYAYWLSYCTKKSYAWLCTHNVTEIRDRRVLRHVEKDTKKLAQKARKERNDEVRALVLFVRKRDRRVVEYRRLLEDRAEQNRIKQQAKRLEQIQRNRAEVEEAMRLQKEAGIGAFGGDYERQLRKMEATYGSDSDDVSDEDTDEEDGEGAASVADDVNEIGTRLEQDVDIDDEEEYVDHLYCVACNKSFKNESSMQNHQSSKRHNDNIEKMRIQMLDEEDAHNAALSDSSASEEATEEQTAELDISIESTKEKLDIPESDSENVLKPNKQSKKSKRKVQKVITTPPTTDVDSDVNPIGSSVTETEAVNGTVHNIEDDDVQPPKQTKKAKRRAMKSAAAADLPPVAKPAKSKNASRKPADSSDGSDGEAADSWSNGTRKMSRKAGAKAARKTAAKKPAIVDIDETVDIDHTCVTCAAVFDSKNKLFAHLKHMNHGVYIEGKGVTPARAAAAAAATIAASQPRTKGRKK